MKKIIDPERRLAMFIDYDRRLKMWYAYLTIDGAQICEDYHSKSRDKVFGLKETDFTYYDWYVHKIPIGRF